MNHAPRTTHHAPRTTHAIIAGLSWLALSSANATPVNVSSTNFEGCNALLNMGLYNVTQSDSAKSAEYQAMATFCSYDYSSSNISSSQSAQIEASYGLFSGGAGGSASRQEIITKQSQVCSLGFNSSKYWEKASAYSKTVYQGSLDAWNRCQDLANKGMEFEVQPSSTMQGVNVAITAPSGYQATFYGVTQHGQGRSTCKIMANGKITPISLTKPFTFDAASKVTVDCNRVMKKTGNDLSADAQDMVFVTSAKNLVVPLAAIGSFSRVTADQLKQDINQGFSGTIAAFNATQCPSGWIPADGTNGSPDLRGEFVRGLDNGRGVDAGRNLTSWQAPTITTTAIGPDALHQVVIEGSSNNVASLDDFSQGMQADLVADSWYGNTLKGLAFAGSYAAYRGNSAGLPVDDVANRPLNNNPYAVYGGTRPRNVALLYCVKM